MVSNDQDDPRTERETADRPVNPARDAKDGRDERPTTEYGANAEAPDGGQGYVEGADLPAEGRDDAPQG